MFVQGEVRKQLTDAASVEGKNQIYSPNFFPFFDVSASIEGSFLFRSSATQLRVVYDRWIISPTEHSDWKNFQQETCIR